LSNEFSLFRGHGSNRQNKTPVREVV
jgi:hypothetical protein